MSRRVSPLGLGVVDEACLHMLLTEVSQKLRMQFECKKLKQLRVKNKDKTVEKGLWQDTQVCCVRDVYFSFVNGMVITTTTRRAGPTKL